MTPRCKILNIWGAAGEGLVVSQSGPSVFLHGQAVYDLSNLLIAGSNKLPCCRRGSGSVRPARAGVAQ